MPSITIVILLVLLNLSAVLFANVQVYRARFISDEFSDSKYIRSIMASFLQILLVSVPLIFLVYENPRAFFFVVSSIVLITSTAMLLLIFVPKLAYIRKDAGTTTSATTTNGLDSSDRRASLGMYDKRSSKVSGRSIGVSRYSEDSDVCFTNKAEVVATLKKELEDCRKQLIKSKAILYENRLDFKYNIPEIVDDDGEDDVSFEEVRLSSIATNVGSFVDQILSITSSKSMKSISRSSGASNGNSVDLVSKASVTEDCLGQTERTISCKSVQSLSRAVDIADPLPKAAADAGLDRSLRVPASKGAHLKSISSDYLVNLSGTVIDGSSDDPS